jgi:hypothetical protein
MRNDVASSPPCCSQAWLNASRKISCACGGKWLPTEGGSRHC